MTIPSAPESNDDGRFRRLQAVCWLAAVLLGGLHAWADRYTMNGDGISYLEMGEAYLRGDWGAAINAYWSPLYSWLLGLAILLLNPTPYWEFPAVHLVNFAIYLCTLGCFHFFLRQVIACHQTRAGGSPQEGASTHAIRAWWIFGYALFVWSTLTMIGMAVVSPDMCVALFVYLAAGILLRIRQGSTHWRTFALLGLVLGFGYLAKAAMFPLAFVFLGCAVLSLGNLRRAAPLGCVALVVFLLVGGPFVLALSEAKGWLTFGESARVTYSVLVNGTPNRHWQGKGPRGVGTPKHATRMVFDSPAIYEFGGPIAGTYPPWYDPSYWYDGVTPHFDWRQLKTAVTLNGEIFLDMFLSSQGGLVAGFLIAFIAGGKGWSWMHDIGKQWILLVPALAAVLMYLPIHLEPRFIASFVVLLWLGIASAAQVSKSRYSQGLLPSVTLATGAVLILAVGVLTAPKLYATAREMVRGIDPSAHVQWQIADGLRRMGVQPGDKVGIIGQGTDRFYAYWARLARVKIVAEMVSYQVPDFIALDALTRCHANEAFANAGASFIVADNLPSKLVNEGWQRIETMDYFVYTAGNRSCAAANDVPGMKGP